MTDSKALAIAAIWFAAALPAAYGVVAVMCMISFPCAVFATMLVLT